MTGASYKAKCLCLKKTKLGETDLILTLLSDEGKQIRAVAKGARKPGNKRFGARLEPVSFVTLTLYPGKTLDSITDCSIIKSYNFVREELFKNCSVLIILEMLDKITRDGEVNKRHFDMLIAYLDSLDYADENQVLALLNAMLLKSFVMLGVGPLLTNCARCLTPVLNPSFFSISLGGVLCQKCAKEVQGASINHELFSAINYLLSSHFSDINIKCSSLLETLLNINISWLEEHLDIKLKTVQMFYSLLPIT